MIDILAKSAEEVSMFCRLNANSRKNIPIRSSEMGLLILTVKSQTPVTPLMAADFFKVKKPMITAMVNSLCDKGYLEKITSLQDKRSFTLNPTEKARKLTNETYDEYFKAMENLRSKLGNEEFDQLIKLLSKANKVLLNED